MLAPRTLTRLVVVLVLAGLCCRASGSNETHPADATRLALAAAFEKKDVKVIGELVFDGWSGLRFTRNWGDNDWKVVSRAIREAKLKTSSVRTRIYSVTFYWAHAPGVQTRDVEMSPDNVGHWKLDYNSFLGPFPHE
jgi:hypothetical protein